MEVFFNDFTIKALMVEYKRKFDLARGVADMFKVIESAKVLVDGDVEVMNENTIENYYSKKLNFGSNVFENVEILYGFYLEKINDGNDEIKVKETFLEYLKLFSLRKLDGLEIISDKIAAVGRKRDNGKKNLNYLIGCFRNILESGLSATNSNVENRVFSAFENVYGITLSYKGKDQILSSISLYGAASVVLTIMENTIDVEEIVIKYFTKLLEDERRD